MGGMGGCIDWRIVVTHELASFIFYFSSSVLASFSLFSFFLWLGKIL